MAGEKYEDKAIANLLGWFENNLQTYLTAVETAQSLTAGTLAPPVDYVPGDLGDDPRSPLLLVFCTGSEEYENTRSLHRNSCVARLRFTSDADIEAGKLLARRYKTALLDTVYADRTLGGSVVHAIIIEETTDGVAMSDAETSHAIDIGVEVVTHDA